MRRFQYPHLRIRSGCPHTGKKKPYSASPAAANSAPPDLSDTYIISDTVLSLDGESCPAVRPYTESDHVEQIKKWSAERPDLTALRERMAAFRKEVNQARINWHNKLRPIDPRRVTERDVLSVSFLGVGPPIPVVEPRKKGQPWAPTGDTDYARLKPNLLLKMGINYRVAGNTRLAVRFLRQRLKFQSQLDLTTEAVTTTSLVPELKRRLHDVGIKPQETGAVMNTIVRIVAPFLRTDEGCQLVSLCGDELVSACMKQVERAESRKLKVLCFLKNVAFNLKRRQIRFDETVVDRYIESMNQSSVADELGCVCRENSLQGQTHRNRQG
ncbi:hypothetical protein B0H66DRAFT_192475 [Apodospora peruviana]|uniref:Uncharacterized protein n=1 Tax=Apodospora peruviana TaxID=516989 RepID=A0AAE0IC09_9PEZI|nr:hypothetical protein B0H66DRAFT_192475 [Apodospora peruviana]